MTWFRVDDSFTMHPKVLAIPRKDRPAAIGLWTLAGTWSARNLTDGILGTHMIEELGVPKKFALILVEVQLWHPPGKECDACLACAVSHKAELPNAAKSYRYHCWHEYQPARAAIEKTRLEDKERKAAARAAKAAKRQAEQESEGTPLPEPPDDDDPSDWIPDGLPPVVPEGIPYDFSRVTR